MRDPDPMNADEVLAVLEGPPRRGLLERGQDLADRLSRGYLDQLIRTTARHIGERHVACESPARVVVLNACIDEAAAAIHLSARSFYPQAISHLRSIYEHRDLAVLFRQQPEWAARWMDHDNAKRWRELRPAAVREKLGVDRRDPIYEMLSESGPHPTAVLALENIKGVQVRLPASGESESRRRISFELQYAGTFNLVAGIRCVLVLVSVIGAAALEAMTGCGFCAREKTIRRFAKDLGSELGRLVERHLRPLGMSPDASVRDAAELQGLFEACAKEYLASAGPGE